MLIVLATLATGKMNIERDAHAVLKPPDRRLRRNIPHLFTHMHVSSAGIGLNEQKTMPKANWVSPGELGS